MEQIRRARLTRRSLLAAFTLEAPIGHEAPLRASPRPERRPLAFQSLREHIGSQEEVNLNVYFVGFPSDLHGALRAQVAHFARNLDIKDARPWQIPNRPKFEAEEFAQAPDRLLEAAVEEHRRAMDRYDDWDYEQVIGLAQRVISLTDQALTRMGEPDLIHDPLQVGRRAGLGSRPAGPASMSLPTLSQLKRSVAAIRLEDWATAGPRH